MFSCRLTMQKIKQLFFVASVKNTSLKDSPSPSVIHLVYFYNKNTMKLKSLIFTNWVDRFLTDFVCSMYDVDGNGFIELSEMTKLVKSIFSMMNNANDRRAHLNPSERARTIFRAMDRDCDGGDKIFFGFLDYIYYLYLNN